MNSNKDLKKEIIKSFPSIVGQILNTPNHDLMCCDCSHFRMWKPQPEWCTEKKERVNPLNCNCPMFTRRKNLKYFGINK